MKKSNLNQAGVIGHVELILVVVLVVAIGVVYWKVNSNDDQPLANQQSTQTQELVAQAELKTQLAQTAQLIDIDGDGTPQCVNGISTDCETADQDNDFDNDGMSDDVDTDDDNDGILDEQDTDKDNDGVEDADETDSDGDGIDDASDPDDNNDGVKDSDSEGSEKSSDSGN